MNSIVFGSRSFLLFGFLFLTFDLLHRSLLPTLLPLYELLFPPICIVCDGARKQNGKVCPTCWSQLKRVQPGDELYLRARDMLTLGGTLDGFATAYYFEKESPLRNIIHQLKYGSMPSLGLELGRRVGEAFRQTLDARDFSAILPIPLHPVKQRERGYNQSQYIARGIAGALGIPMASSMLVRRKHTRSQTTMTAREREHNVKGAFTVPPRAAATVSGNSFLLVDDVITTGATIREAASTLKSCGAVFITACSVALAELT